MNRPNSILRAAVPAMGATARTLSLLAMSCLAAFAQESATVHGPEFVRAGEALNLIVTVDKAPNFTGSSLQLTLQGPKTGYSYGIALVPGKTEYSAQMTIPEGATGGTWSVNRLEFMSGGGESFPLPFAKYTFEVIPKKDLVYPTSADVGMRPSQAQLLRTEAIHLQARIQDLKGQILEHKFDAKLTSLLRQNVEKEIQSLNETEHAFRNLDNSPKQQEDSRVFFDDLRTSYREADHELKAQRIKGPQYSLLLASAPQKNRETARYPVVAQAVLRAFEQNELAYNTAADAQTLTFDLEVTSIPTGAAVSYRRRGDEFKQAPTPTDSTIKALAFAIWIIRFEKDGFRPAEREHDPFREPNHVITVELPKVK